MKIQEVGYILHNFVYLCINLTFQSYIKVQESESNIVPVHTMKAYRGTEV